MSNLEILGSLQRIEGALEEVIFYLREQNLLIETEYERNEMKNISRRAESVSRTFENLMVSTIGKEDLPRAEVEAMLGTVHTVRTEFDQLVDKLASALAAARHKAVPLEHFVIPTTVVAILGTRLTAISLMPSLLIGLVNRETFRTRHTMDYLRHETIHEAQMRLRAIEDVLAAFGLASNPYQRLWLTDALRITPEATFDGKVATIPVRMVATRGFMPGSYFVMRIEWVLPIAVSVSGTIEMPARPVETVTFLTTTKKEPEASAPGRVVRQKAWIIPAHVRNEAERLKKENPLALNYKGAKLDAAYLMYAQIDRDRKAMENAKIAAYSPRETTTWPKLVSAARAHAEKLAFVVQGSEFLADRQQEIVPRLKAVRGQINDR
ncbi:hypothetical protein E2974_09785 [Paracoccus yeei]|uniref:hypothetical protein n=1 Tax=Paracoccus yeei TaxID=147645 RepID=UPI003BF89E0B